MTDRIKGTLKGRPNATRVSRFLIALCLGALLASATIVPPERVASALRQKVSATMAEDCPQAASQSSKTEAKNTATRTAQEVKKSVESGHSHPDPVRNLLRGILL
jgi:hypothetical protein